MQYSSTIAKANSSIGIRQDICDKARSGVEPAEGFIRIWPFVIAKGSVSLYMVIPKRHQLRRRVGIYKKIQKTEDILRS